MNPLTLVGLILLGWFCSILVNYLADVLPVTRKFSRVACPVCQKNFGLWDYLSLRSCRNCGKRRSIRAWLVSGLAAAGAVWLAMSSAAGYGFWIALIVLVYFALVMVIDIEHRLILHPVSLFGAFLGLAVGTWQHGLWRTLLGGLAGFGFMLLVYFIGIWFGRWLAKRRNQETEEEAFGFGDVALSGVIGLFLGWPGILAGLVLGVLLGGIGSLLVLVYSLVTKKYHAFLVIPYGPFLVIATIFLLFRAG
jgi:leader peptidase (prepilin peptidase) / N-methyltransferase